MASEKGLFLHSDRPEYFALPEDDTTEYSHVIRFPSLDNSAEKDSASQFVTESEVQNQIALYIARNPVVPKTSWWDRLGFIGMWWVLVIGLFFLYRLFSNQQRIEDSENRSVSRLTTALVSQQGEINATGTNLKTLNGRVDEVSKAVTTNSTMIDSRFKALNQYLVTRDQSLSALVKRIDHLEALEYTFVGSNPINGTIPLNQGNVGSHLPHLAQPVEPIPAPHHHNFNGNFALVKGAIPHRTVMGEVDYWYMPTGTYGKFARVMPFEVLSDGNVRVHSMEDFKDYTLTRSGEWK